MGDHFTVGKLAVATGSQEHQIRRLADRGKIPHVRAGKYRVFIAPNLAAIKAALIEAGYLKADSQSPVTTGVV